MLTGGPAINIDAKLTRDMTPVLPRQPRAQGRMEVVSKLRDGRSRIADLHQSGSFKALFPKGNWTSLYAVVLNTAGGVTGGDTFHLSAEARAASHMVLTTQAAERIYRAQPGEVGQVRTELRVAEGARIDWLPQETILFDHAALDRRLEARLASDARLLVVEPVIFGRGAMGEVVNFGQFRDQWRIHREDELIFADSLRLSGDMQARLNQAAVGAGARAMASLLLVAPDADLYLDALRDALGDSGGASIIRPGVLYARSLAVDGFTLRRHIIPAIQALSGADIPKTWTL